MKRNKFIKLIGAVPFLYSMANLRSMGKLSESLPYSEKMPVLFLGHGSPMNAIEENEFVKGFRDVSAEIPRPSAILCISAHWFINGTKVTAMEMPKTIHDFGGFPRELYEVQYPAPGSPDLAAETKKILQPAEVDLDLNWGLDHGAWSVIKHLYPDADIPVIQMSIDYTKPPEYHYELANKLISLRDKGILIIGSGNIVHNLRMVDFNNINKIDYAYDWAREARIKINQQIMDGNIKSILEYEGQGEALRLAVPTPDHFLPLIYTLGLKEKSEVMNIFNDKLLGGSISMTSLKIG